jgi:hypothetical protein
MDHKNNRVYRVLPWLLALAVLCLFILSLRTELTRQDDLWRQYLTQQQTVQQAILLTSQNALTRQAMLLAQLVAQDQTVVTLIRHAYQIQQESGPNTLARAGLREQLNERLQPCLLYTSPSPRD